MYRFFILLFVYNLVSCIYASGFDCDSFQDYSPLNQSGPSYSIEVAELSKNLKCYQKNDYEKRWILFFPGSTEEIDELYSWNWLKIMDENEWSYCTLVLPDKGLGDLQIAAEYVVYAIRYIYQRAEKEKEKGFRQKLRINIIGDSAGGTLPRFALRFWPDTRSMVYQLIAFGPTNHGTILANIACYLFTCPIAVIQQRINSSFICALNSYQETFDNIKYINILSKFDELVRPVKNSYIRGKHVSNLYIQDYCPWRIFTEHLVNGLYDYCGYYITINALDSQPLTDISKNKCCEKVLMPGIDQLSTIEFIFKVISSATQHAFQLLSHFGQAKFEPELKCSFRTDCIQTNEYVQINRR